MYSDIWIKFIDIMIISYVNKKINLKTFFNHSKNMISNKGLAKRWILPRTYYKTRFGQGKFPQFQFIAYNLCIRWRKYFVIAMKRAPKLHKNKSIKARQLRGEALKAARICSLASVRFPKKIKYLAAIM